MDRNYATLLLSEAGSHPPSLTPSLEAGVSTLLLIILVAQIIAVSSLSGAYLARSTHGGKWMAALSVAYAVVMAALIVFAARLAFELASGLLP